MEALEGRIQVPASVRAGESFAVRVVLRHAMETGFRHDDAGRRVGQNTLPRFEARFDGQTVFSAELASGTAANPLLVFYLRAHRPGLLVCEWQDESGARGTMQAMVKVQ